MKTRRRIATIVTVAIAAICFIGGWVYFHYARPVGTGPAGPIVPKEAFGKTWTERPVLLVGLGDSVTAGFGARRGYSYFDRLASNPTNEFPDMAGISLRAVLPELSITNFSVSGSTSIELLNRQLPRLAASGTNIFGLVVMTTGGNDLIHNYGRTPPREEAMYGASWEEAQSWIKNFEQRLETIVQGLNARFPGGCEIFVANIYDPTDDVGDIQNAGLPAWPDARRILTTYNEVIRQCAERHDNLHLIDIRSAFLGHGIHCTQFWRKHYNSHDPHYWYFINLEDPNERGYDAIRRLFLIEMAKVSPKFGR